MDKIIIDGIDVSGCKLHIKDMANLEVCCSLHFISDNAGMDIVDYYCKDCPNCYYKQLQREKEINAELNLQNERLVGEKYKLNEQLISKTNKLQIATEALGNGQYMDCEHCPRGNDKKCYSSDDCKEVYKAYFAQALERIKE